MDEVAAIAFDSLAGSSIGLDCTESLPLYPFSLYPYAMPFAIWGRESARWMGSGYVCTLGMVGGIINFIYPVQLLSYSFLSFRGLHTLLYHGNLIFTFLVMMESGYFSYRGMTARRYLVYASVPTLMLLLPANLLNNSKIGSDCMYFPVHFHFSRDCSHIPHVWELRYSCTHCTYSYRCCSSFHPLG